MAKRISERSRWVTVFTIYQPDSPSTTAKEQHRQALAIVKAFAKVGRVVRVEPTSYGDAIDLKARRA